ncbi:MAG: FliA/WhiG family RNA polymerase sigma factor [Candidatus Hydrogenedentes bacterium]|nr:FliA/WhiG family RNA polymerase sigma factor [Candidatus Hydrogenedentota bacterium]
MSSVEEKNLWKRYREEGDEKAREALINKYLPLVKYIVGRVAIHLPPNIEMDDLIGWGIVGLLDAMERYDYKQDTRFNTYACIRIKGTILDQVRLLDWAPRSLRSMARRVNVVKEKLRYEKGGDPTLDEIAKYLGVTKEEVEDVISNLQTVQVLSLDHFIIPEAEEMVERTKDINANAYYPSPDEILKEKELKELLVKAILELPEQQQKLLHLYYYEELTLKEIGAVLNVSESRACQIHAMAIRTLKEKVKQWV